MHVSKGLFPPRSLLGRREFLRLSGTGAAGALLLPPSAAALPHPRARAFDLNRTPDPRHDVVVIGAGLSGLMAARTLEREGIADVKVLEGRGRVGGRTLNRPLRGGGLSEDGGHWIGPTQDSILRLMDELGIGKYPFYRQGKVVDDTETEIGPVAYLDYLWARQRLNALAMTVPVDRPWDAPDAREIDAMTLQEWMDANMFTEGGKILIGAEAEIPLGSPSDLSLLYFLFYVHSATDIEHLSEKAQSWQIHGGTQLISLKLAEQLGGALQVDAAVDAIDYTGDTARIQYRDHLIEAERVIVAMMPLDADRITFIPELPRQRAALPRAWMSSPAIVINVSYQTPFWRDQGFSGIAVSEDQYLAVTFDQSPPDGSSGVLMAFANTDRDIPTNYRERLRLTIASLTHFFGPQAAQPLDYKEYDWAGDPFSAGAVSVLRPHVLTELGPAIRRPVGPIHWAGTETSEIWNGYLDGAVRAGVRAAREVAVRLV